MTMTDPIADLLTTIRNALIVKHDQTEAPASKQKIALCRELRDQGYIRHYDVYDSPPGRPRTPGVPGRRRFEADSERSGRCDRLDFERIAHRRPGAAPAGRR